MYQKIESDEDVNALVSLAHEIWGDHFKSIFDSKTLAQVIEGVQSKKAILSQIEGAYRYFFIIQDDNWRSLSNKCCKICLIVRIIPPYYNNVLNQPFLHRKGQ